MQQQPLRKILCLFPIALGVAALAGWSADIEVLKRIGPATVAMNPLTAVCFILLGLEALRMNISNSAPVLARYGLMAVAAVLGFIGLKFADLGLGTSFHADAQLFAGKLLAETGRPNTMAPNTAFCFAVMGLSLLCFRKTSPVWALAGQALALLPGLVALLALTGYGYGVKPFYGVGAFIPMALNTALGFIALSGAAQLTKPEQGFMRPLVADGPSSRMAKLLLPAAAIFPVAFGWLSLEGQRAGYYDGAFGIALSVVLDVVVLFALIGISARMLYKADAIRRNAEALIQFQATHDALTGLPNRQAFMNRLEDCFRKHASEDCAVFYLDLDGFKQVNDRFGHDAGDKLLKEVAQSLNECLRDGDTVARLGGDEFTLLMEKIRGPKEVAIVAQRIIDKMPHAVAKDDKEVSVGISIGVALGAACRGGPDDVLHAADEALYRAKAEGKGCYKMSEKRAN